MGSTTNDNENDRGAALLAQVLSFRAGPQLAARVASYAMNLERRTGKLNLADAIRGLILLGLEAVEAENAKARKP